MKMCVEPKKGFEPLTCWLQSSCSTTELLRHPQDTDAQCAKGQIEAVGFPCWVINPTFEGDHRLGSEGAPAVFLPTAQKTRLARDPCFVRLRRPVDRTAFEIIGGMSYWLGNYQPDCARPLLQQRTR